MEIIYDANCIVWDHNKPQFVVVKFDNGDIKLCNPSQLKRSKI